MKLTEAQFNVLLKTLTNIGISLSMEKDHSRLLELILIKAQEITNADGGTIYTCTEDNTLKFEIMINNSMNIHLGGTRTNQASFENLSLYNEKGKPNKHMLAPWAAISRKTINLKDAYSNTRFDLSGTREFDRKNNYHSKSFLTVPMTNHLNEVIGVLQLINAKEKKTNQIIAFSKLNQQLAESLASQAAVTISNRQLIRSQKELFDALIQLIAGAIDEKSAYTGGHCRRVPIITLMLAKAACNTKKGALKDFSMTEDELYELEVAAWLHDCGKITTPESVVDKATKLEQIVDGVHLIDTRFEVLKRDKMIASLQKKIAELTDSSYNLNTDQQLQSELQQLDQERELIRTCNRGGESILPRHLKAIHSIAANQWQAPNGQTQSFLTQDEIQNLTIARGTLSIRERNIINNHVAVSIKMLESLPYPKNLKKVPELAGSHHEKMDGTGYPRGLSKDQMSLPARMIAIADIFEALTAADRPYKKAMPLDQALSILGQMKLDGHIDPDLFDVFIDAGIPEQYAAEHLGLEH